MRVSGHFGDNGEVVKALGATLALEQEQLPCLATLCPVRRSLI